jgi:hypothetical protein
MVLMMMMMMMIMMMTENNQFGLKMIVSCKELGI